MIYHWWFNQEINNGYAYATNIFSTEELELIKQTGKNPELSTFENPLTGVEKKEDDYRKCQISFIRSDLESNQWIFKRLTDVILEINKKYFNFDLDYIQSLQFTKYGVNDKYEKHTDISSFAERVRKLSFVLQLSDQSDYQEGDLKIYYSANPYIADKKKGTLTVFPSYALHEVVPVTSGVRYSLVGWACGPAFK